MEPASSSAPSTSYPNLSLAQAVVTLSINAAVVGISAIIKSATSSSSSGRRRDQASPAPSSSTAAPPSPPAPEKASASNVLDMDVVLGLMGAAGPAAVGFEEAAALFDEEEATVEEARAAFAVFDRDGDGFIDAAELGSVLRSLGFVDAGAAECRRMIDAYDEDKDGRVDFREFVKLMEGSCQ